MAEILAHVGETVLHFPEGTPPDVIQARVKTLLASQKTSTPTDPHTAYSEGAQPKTAEPKDSFISSLFKMADIAGNTPGVKLPPLKDTLAGLAGIAASESGPVGASFAMAGAKAVLNKLTGDKQDKTLLSKAFPDSGDSSIKTTLEGTLENEALGKVLSVGGSAVKKGVAAFKEAVNPGSVVGPDLANNTRSFSQMAEKGQRGFSRWLEDVFAPTEKIQRTTETNQVLQGQLEKKAENLSGQPVDLGSATSDTTRHLGSTQQKLVEENFTHSIAASNQKADAIHVIAQQNNPATIASGGSSLSTAGAKLPGVPNVNGPIYMKDTIQAAQEYLHNFTEGLVTPDPDNPLFKAATKIINEAQPVFDSAGNITHAEPISFKKAWQFKKEAGDLAFGSPKSDVSVTDSRFGKIFNTLDSDIENSMKQWPNNGDKAAQLWNDTKRIVSNRYEQFMPTGEAGAKVKDLLNAKDVQINALDSIILEPEKLQRLLNTGDLTTLLSQNGKEAPYSSIGQTNTRKVLKGYGISRIWQNGTSLNADGVPVPDPKKMYEMWQNASNTTSMKMIYSAADRANISMFFKDLANVNQKMFPGGSTYLKLRGTMAGIALTGGLVQSLATNGSILPIKMGEAVGGGIASVILSAHRLGLLLTNKNTARIMQGMAQSRLDVPVKVAARLIAGVLRGQIVDAEKPDGTKTSLKVQP